MSALRQGSSRDPQVHTSDTTREECARSAGTAAEASSDIEKSNDGLVIVCAVEGGEEEIEGEIAKEGEAEAKAEAEAEAADARLVEGGGRSGASENESAQAKRAGDSSLSSTRVGWALPESSCDLRERRDVLELRATRT